MNSSRPWHAEKIKYEIRIRGTSLREIATDLGINPTVVSATIRHPSQRSRRVEAAVADVIGVPPEEIWPDRYQAGTSAAG